jgi:hypothetical protein
MRRYFWVAVMLPYTLQLTGQSPFYAKQGVPTCLAMAREELGRQKNVIERGCSRDGGRLIEGAVVETLVHGVHCTAVQPLTCDSAGPVRASRPMVPEPDQAPRS